MENTINAVFRNRSQTYNSRLALEKKRDGRWESVTWAEYYEQARAAGMGLNALGINRGDRLALLSENRLEWIYTDMGTLGIGGCVIPVYPTLTVREVAYIVENSGARVLVVENGAQLAKARQVLDQVPTLEKVVVMEAAAMGDPHPAIMAFSDLLSLGRQHSAENAGRFETLANATKPEDLATIVYTSGTTGVPKGAMITHGNIMSVIRSLDAIAPPFADETDITVPFLPLSHVFERAAGHFYGMYKGITASYAESINTLLEDFKEKRPTMILAVPRVCEKVYQKIIMQVQNQPPWRQKIFYWGQGIGARISELREAKKTVPLADRIRYKIAYAMIFRKLQGALGGRVRWMTASGAPTAREIVLFFNAAGIQVVEGYGMTECFAPATMSNLADYRIGTVGRPLPGMDIRLAEDGEILIKGGNVFTGYWQMEEETRESFDRDGYFKTGDIGSFDAEGFLTITDRKKNILITSGGKNIAPQKIENIFMGDPIFAQFLVIGDRRKYLSALVTINLDQAAVLAATQGIPFADPVDLLADDDFLALVDQHVETGNRRLPRFETIKKYRIVKHEFSQETGELTPSLKIKRKVVLDKYQALVESMYEEELLN